MNPKFIKPLLILVNVFFVSCFLLAQELNIIKLNPPDKTRGLPFMETLSVKASATEWSNKDLSLQDLSDLLWAANGLNRPEENKTTASSAMNAHDVDIYVFMKEGVFVYDFHNHELDLILTGDLRSQVVKPRPPSSAEPPESEPANAAPALPSPSDPPLQIILISDTERFRAGSNELKYEWGAIDTGIISQNISLFCAATGLKTRPRASMDKERIRDLLKLKATQHVFLNHPVGYKK
jgi:SagB-type dehydrogenase family enzyme